MPLYSGFNLYTVDTCDVLALPLPEGLVIASALVLGSELLDLGSM